MLRCYQVLLMYAPGWKVTLNIPTTSDPSIPAHIGCEKCDEMSVALKLISLIILLTYISTELLPHIDTC